MKQVVMEKSFIYSPFAKPTRHFMFGEKGIADEIPDGRRPGAVSSRLPDPAKKTRNSGDCSNMTEIQCEHRAY